MSKIKKKRKDKPICIDGIVRLIQDIQSKLYLDDYQFIILDGVKEKIEEEHKIKLDWKDYEEALKIAEQKGIIRTYECLYYI